MKKIPFLLLALLLCNSVLVFSFAPTAWATGPVVDKSCSNFPGGTQATSACTLGSVPSGDVLVVTVDSLYPPAATPVSDNKTGGSNTYTLQVQKNVASMAFCGIPNCYYSSIYTTTPPSTHGLLITATSSSASDQMTIVVLAVSNIGATAIATATNECHSSCSTSITTSSSIAATGDLAVATDFCPSSCTSGNTPMTPGAGYTYLHPNTAAPNYVQGAMYSTSISGNTNFPMTTPGASPAAWTISGATFGPSSVTQVINISTLKAGAPSATIGVSGCSVSNSTFVANGNPHTYSGVQASCTITLTEPSDGTNTRYRWNISPHPTAATSITFTSSGSTYSNNTYYQLQETYSATPSVPNTWDAAYSYTGVKGTILGVAATSCGTITLGNGGGAASANLWCDYNFAVTYNNFASTGRGGTWTPQNPKSFTDTTGGNSHNVNFKLTGVIADTFTVNALAQANFDTGMTWAITGTIGGSPATVCTISSTAAPSDSCTGYPDNSTTVTFPASATGAPANSRWESASGAAVTTPKINITGFTFAVNYYKQWNEHYSYLWYCVGGASCSGQPTLSYTSLGNSSKSVTEGTSPATVYIDANSVASVTPSLTDNKHNVYKTSPVSWTITAADQTGNPSVYSVSSFGQAVTAWLVPDTTHLSNSLLILFMPLAFMGFFTIMIKTFKQKGDLGVLIALAGLTVGSFVADFSATSSATLAIPFADGVVAALLTFLWWWNS